MRDHILLQVNGTSYRLGESEAGLTLSRFLRYALGMTGTKIVCEEGDCGACTVLVGRGGRYRAVNSCIQMVFQLDGAHVVTVEGLGGKSAVQDAMVRCHGAQCGYCTPGFVMALAGMVEEGECDARKGLTGNLCRCTGYESIIKAAAESVSEQQKISELYDITEPAREAVRVGNFFKPTELKDAIQFKADHPKCIIVQGGTDFGVWTTKRGFQADAILSLDAIEGLTDVHLDGRTLIVGARVSLSDFEKAVQELVPEMAPIMDRFGSPQIKNAGTLAGNIANASPIADTLPFLFVTDAKLEVEGLNGTRTIPIKDFYKGYKKLDLQSDEIITRVHIPLPENETLRLYKISKRSHLDISSFTAAMLMKRADGRVDSIRIAYGGVAPVVLRLPKTEEFLAGKTISRETFAAAGEIAKSEVAPISDVRGSRDFRLQLAQNILQKFYFEACV